MPKKELSEAMKMEVYQNTGSVERQMLLLAIQMGGDATIQMEFQAVFKMVSSSSARLVFEYIIKHY